MDSKLLRLTALAMLLVAMAGCATVEPFPIPANNPPLANVRADIAAHQNQYVAWGGRILATEVKQAVSMVTILAKPLDSNGEPIETDQSYGRFLARFTGFRDPAIFAVGRNLTIAGTLQGSETRKIGEYDYLHPIVNVETYRLWPVRTAQHYDAYDYWWYDPWYPGYPVYYPSYRVAPPPRKVNPNP